MVKNDKILTLDKIKRGENFLIKKILDPEFKYLSTRLGVNEGQLMKCIHRSGNGPVILQKRFQEIALGKSLTKNIQVQKVS